MTQSGDVIDFSAHFFLLGSASFEEKSNLARTLRETEGPIYREVEATMERLESGGVDEAVFSNTFFVGGDDVGATQEANDALYDLVGPYANLHALASLPTGAGGSASAEEFERCLELGFTGGAIETWNHERDSPPEAFESVFEVADDSGAPVFLHPKVQGSLGADVLNDAHRSNAVFGRGVALAHNIYVLIHRGYFDRYPGVNLVVHHMGGNVAGMIGRVRGVLYRAFADPYPPNDSLELQPFEEFETQLREHVYVDTAGFDGDPHIYRAALEVLSADHLVFGSDYPCEVRNGTDYERHIDGIEGAMDPEAASRVLGGNAKDLLVNR